MKKTILFAAVLCMGAAAFSQDTSVTRPMGGDSMNNSTKNGTMNGNMGMNTMKDCVMMEHGTLTVMKGGQTMPLAHQMTFPNGTVVTTNGTVTTKNGSTKMMKDGDCINMDGTMSKMSMMHDKMKMKKDSTMM